MYNKSVYIFLNYNNLVNTLVNISLYVISIENFSFDSWKRFI